MRAFNVALEWLDTQLVVLLNDVERGRRVRIARHGACVLGIEAQVGDQTIQLADGYQNAVDVIQRPGSRFALLAPFANRVGNARYRFEGVEHDLTPDAVGASRASRHGFVRDTPFAIASLDADDRAAHVLFATTIAPRTGYPFALDLAVSYTLAADGLALTTTLRNIGTTAAPAFVGWHPYFRVGAGSLETWELAVPAACVIRTDKDSIPLPGQAAYLPLAQAPELDFRRQRAVGALVLDHTYAGLIHDADGRARTRLCDPSSGFRIAVWQECGVLLAYTGDTLERGPRNSLALEPMESLPDAFNRPDCAGTIRLETGATRTFRCGVEIESPSAL